MYKKGIRLLILSLLVIISFIINTVEKETSNISTYIESSDAILIESNGKFGLVDAGEDTGTSKKNATQKQIDKLNTKGYEEVVVSYLKDIGVKNLEFEVLRKGWKK